MSNHIEPKVSVIIPAYNCENYIRECLNSVVNNSYRNIEVIIVDDCSDDKTGEVCDFFANNDSRIYVEHCSNRGGYQEAEI